MKGFLEEHTFGIAATLIFHIVVLGAMTVFHFDPLQGTDNEEFMDILLDMEELEKILEQTEGYEKVQAEDVKTGVRDLSIKERLERGKQIEFNKTTAQKTQEQIEKELKELERSEFERLAEERGPIAQYEPKEKKIEEESEEEGEDVSEIPEGATVSFDLPGWNRPKRIYIPAYLCRGQGSVIVNITVDQEGKVQQAKVDENSSSSNVSCHHKYAKESALSTHFNRDDSRSVQYKGTITYIFLAQ